MNKESFIEELKKINIEITESQLSLLDKYYEILITENEKINLTGITIKEDVYLKHFYDSLTINKIIELDNQSICDIGSGAGFPGIVLKIVFPNLKVTLVDSLEKRCNFLKLVIDKLNLQGIEVVNSRAEEYTKNNPEKFDIVTSRAVANLSILLEISILSVKVNGYFIAMKSNALEEMNKINNCLKELNLKLEQKEEFTLPFELSKRTLIKFKKIKSTNIKYPREYGKIKKKPL